MAQPTTTPPGGGRWIWDDKKNEYLPAPEPRAAEPTPVKPAKPTPAQE